MTEEQRFVVFRGERMIEGWPEKIAEAQATAHYRMAGVDYVRVPYGSEQADWGAEQRACGDCCVIRGEVHVPGCDIEECPKCGGQALTCPCGAEDEQMPWRRVDISGGSHA